MTRQLYAVVPPQYYTMTATDDGGPLRVGTVIWRNGNAYGAYSMFEGYVSDDGMVAHSTYDLMHYLHLLYGQRFEIKYKNADGYSETVSPSATASPWNGYRLSWQRGKDGWRSYESYDLPERRMRFTNAILANEL